MKLENKEKDNKSLLLSSEGKFFERITSSWVKKSAIALFLILLIFLVFVSGTFAQKRGIVADTKSQVSKYTSIHFWLMKSDSILRRPNSLPNLTIDMKFKHFKKIEEKRAEALQRGLLFSGDGDFVPAELFFEGRTIPVKMRLKGNGPHHWNSDKWSFRIKVKNEEDDFLGMRRFSIQSPQTRFFVAEWGFLENLRMEGILAPRFQFINVIMNGERKGIYAVEEFFSPEMMFAHQRQQGVFFIFDEELFMERQGRLGNGFDRSLLNPIDYHNLLMQTFTPNKVRSNEELKRHRETGLKLISGFQQETLKPSEVFDVILLARYLALVDLWQAEHGLTPLNSAFFFNPESGKLEPVGLDNKIGDSSRDKNRLISLRPGWTNEVLQDPVIAREYMGELERVTSEDYLIQLRRSIGMGYEQYTDILRREWPKLDLPWEVLSNRQDFLREYVSPPQIVHAVRPAQHDPECLGSEEAEDDCFAIQVANLTALPAEIIGFQFGEGTFVSALDALGSDSSLALADTKHDSVILKATRFSSLERPENGEPLNFIQFSIPKYVGQEAVKLGSFANLMVLNRIVGQSSVRKTSVNDYPQFELQEN